MRIPSTEHQIPLSLKFALGLILAPAMCCVTIMLFCLATHIAIDFQLTLYFVLSCLGLGVLIIVFSHIKPTDIVTEFLNDLGKVGLVQKPTTEQKPTTAHAPQTPTYTESLPNMRSARSVANSKAPETSH